MESTDRRIRKTLTTLKSSLLVLLSKKKLAEVTVSELCETADINRTTFYAHYQTVRDLYEEIEKDELEELKKIMEPDSSHTYNDLYAAIVEHIYNNQLLYKTLFSTKSDFFFNSIMKELKSTFENIWKYEIKSDNLPDNFKYLEIYHLNGIIAVIQDWILEGFITPREKLVVIIKALDYNIDNLEL